MYLSFFGFKDEPFRLTPDPRYLHLSEPHQTALTTLLEGIFYRKGLVMLTGPIGTGKTTLVHTALQLISDRKMPVRSALLFNPVLSRDEFLEMMLEEFEVSCSSPSKPRRLAALHQMLLDTQRGGGTAVLFVDEAHLLSAELLEEIRLLGNADTHDGKLLQIVLSGQPELLTVMQRKELSALQQRIAARANLRPLTAAETGVYVAERLRAAGSSGPSLFTPEALETLHSFSTGVPRLINLIGDACLALGFRTLRNKIQPDMVEEVAASLGVELSCIPAPARSIGRVPVWRNPSAQTNSFSNSPSLPNEAAGNGSGKSSALEVTQEDSVDGTVLVMGKGFGSEGTSGPGTLQKTAVDVLIDAMKRKMHCRAGSPVK